MAEGRGPPPPGRVLAITSLANPLVKEIKALALAKNRKASGLFVAEGLKLVADAIEAGWTIRTLVHATRVADEGLVARLAASTHARGGRVVSVSEAVLAKITRRDNPQTVIGVFEQRLIAAGQIRPRPDAVFVALESVRDPGNLGTIIRTVDAVGGDCVILVGDTVECGFGHSARGWLLRYGRRVIPVADFTPSSSRVPAAAAARRQGTPGRRAGSRAIRR
jgi:TrmH family RNA methyltransferase